MENQDRKRRTEKEKSIFDLLLSSESLLLSSYICLRNFIFVLD